MANKKVVIKISESAEQQRIFAWAALHIGKYPALETLYAIPNGGARDRITGARLKAEGVKAGVSDIHFPVPCGGYASLYIELKSPTSTHKTGTPEQRDWIEKVKKWGNYAQICIGADEAIELIEKYIKGEVRK